MAQPGEKRFTFRLYEDNPADMELDGMMEKLLADGKFRNKNEVLRKGIALAYEACYPAPSGNGEAAEGFTEPGLQAMAGMIADEVVSRLEGSFAGACAAKESRLPDEADKMTDEMASFLSGLNDI